MNTIKFVNRDRELKALSKPLQSEKAEFIIIYGRRRVGKTELIKHLLANLHNAVYFVGRHESSHNLLERISRVISEKMNDGHLERFPFHSFDEVFDYIIRNELILALDEFPYMVTTEPSLPSILQDYWDNQLQEKKTKLILCGSSIAMMEKHLMGYSSPLYGRRTKQLKVEPLQFKDLDAFFPHLKMEERIRIYGVLGGTPAYLLQYEKDIINTIKEKILYKEEFLYRDVEFVLREELREPRFYFSILSSIAQGKTSLNGIMNDSGLTRDIASKYLGVLTDLGIIHRTIPITEGPKSRKGLYMMRDNYFRFWFRFIYPNIDQIELDDVSYVLEKIEDGLPQYLGSVFEEIVLEILRFANGKGLIPFPPTRIGKWWDKYEEIDILALDERTGDILFGEVKFTGKKVGSEVLKELREKSKRVKVKSRNNEYFMIVSRSGFTKNLLTMVSEKIILLTMDTLEDIIR